MNCTEFEDSLVAHAEGLLDAATAEACSRHLAACNACRTRHAALQQLQRDLTARAAPAAGIALADAVVARIHASPTRAARRSADILTPFTRWFVGAGLAAAALAVIGLVAIPARSTAKPADVLQRGVAAAHDTRSIHLRARVRAPAADNFARIDPKLAFVPIELRKEFSGDKRWRVEKPGRVAVMDGQTTLLYLPPPRNTGVRVPRAAPSAFDTDWLHRLADIEATLTHALRMATTQGWKVELTHTTDASGVTFALVTIDAASGVPAGDYLANKFLPTANLRQVYRFHDASGRLEAMQIYLRDGPDFLLVFEVTQIDYNVAFAADTFQVDPAANITEAAEPKPVANNERYARLTPVEAARTFFEACGRRDWAEAQLFLLRPLDERFQNHLGGVTLLSLGEAFKSAAMPADFVPYEIRFANGTIKKHNLALKQHPKSGRWFVDGGL